MERMIVDQFSVKEDNVLIEWILALEGLYSAKSNIEKIFPVFIGRRDKVTRSLSNISILQDPYYSARPLDRRNIIDCLPDGQSDPLLVASLAKAREMLIANEVEPSSKLDQLTVKKIVSGLLEHLGIFLNDLISQKEETFVKEICKQANDILRDTDAVKNVSNSLEEQKVEKEVGGICTFNLFINLDNCFSFLSFRFN
jgi:hypothetical protein